MKPSKKKPAKKSSKSKSLRGATIKKKATSKKSVKAASKGKRVAAKVKLAEKGPLQGIQTENLRLVEQLKQKERELEIEAALERVRSTSMAMHKSQELQEVVNTVFDRLRDLEIETDTAAIIISEQGSTDTENWIQNTEHNFSSSIRMSFVEQSIIAQELLDVIRNPTHVFNRVYTKEEKNQWFGYQFVHSDMKHIPEQRKAYVLNADYYTISHARMKNAGIVLGRYSSKPFTDKENEILKRFAGVFEQAYVRFLDLQKAEAQAREAKIEAALERVRSRSMGMQKSGELKEVIQVVYEQFVHLNILIEHTGFIMDYKKRDDMNIWLADQHEVPSQITIPYFDSPHWNSFIKAKEKGMDFFANHLTFEEKNKFYQDLFKLIPGLPDETKEYYFSCPGLAISTVLLENIGLYIENFSGIPYSDEENATLMRFGKVFQQTYTRFLDLEKAEEQTRLAQIEASLERVRARAMGMHHSDELSEVLSVLFDQFDVLGIQPVYTFLSLVDLDKNKFTYRQTGKGGQRVVAQQVIDLDRMEEWKDLVESMRAGKVDPINCMHFPKESLEKVWEVFDEIYSALPEGSKVYPEDFPDGVYATQAYCKFGYLGFDHTRAASEEDKDILQRFAKEFTRLYQRFLDLQNAEAQAREAQIEAALEKVRSRSLAMHKAEELGEVITVVFDKLKDLNFSVGDGVALITFVEGSRDLNEWMANPGFSSATRFYLPYFEHPVLSNLWNAKNQGTEFLEGRYTAEENRSFLNHIFEYSDYKHTPQEIKDFCLAAGFYNNSIVFQKNTAIFINDYTGHSLSEHEIDILKRVSKVFEQTYTRFLDLQKAEAQAREAQIEAALERVRSRAMAMQTSEELNALIGTVFTELTKLDLVLTRCVIMTYDHKTNDARWWMANSEAPEQPMNFHVQYHEHPPNLAYFSAWREQRVKWIYTLEGNVKKEWDDFIFSETELRLLPDFVIAGMKAPECVYLNASFYNSGNLTLASLEPLSDEHFDILIRFAKVFDLTYTRFNDLKQAEAQAREAKIEAALERVRSRTMAMQRSDELVDVASILFQQVKALGVPQWNCGFNIWDIGDKEFTYYPGSPDGKILPTPCKIPLTEHPVFISFDESRKRGDELFVYEKEGEYQAEHYRYMRSLPGVGDLLQSMLDAGFQLPAFQIDHIANFAYGNLIFITFEHFPEMHDVFKRFAKVFEQTYTRFLDLQKAEAQAKEAQIEAALEKVRSRSLAMHKSDEVGFVVDELFLRMKDLEIGFDSVNILEFTDDAFQVWAAYKPGKFTVTKIPFSKSDIPYVRSAIEAKNSGLQLFTHQYSFEEKNLFLNYLFDETHFKDLPDERKQFLLQCPCYTVSIGFAKNTAIQLQSYSRAAFSVSENNILKRLVNVFEQAYTRFLDLQQAEGQAREAQIQLALERVRARTMAMQHSNELRDAASLLFQQIKDLGIDAWTCGYNIWDEDRKAATAWLSRGVMQPPFKVPLTENKTLMHFNEAAQRGESLFVEEVSGETLIELYRYLGTLLVSGGVSDEIRKPGYAPPTFQVNHVAYFSYGYLLFVTYKQYPEAHDIFKRFAKVFEQTYTRFLDLQKAEAQAREAKIETALERVRSRTMAMQHSSELTEISFLLIKQVLGLGIKTWGCAFNIFDEDQPSSTEWFSNEQGYKSTYKIPREGVFLRYYEAAQRGQSLHVEEFRGDACIEHYKYLSTLPGLEDEMKFYAEHGVPLPTSQFDNVTYFKYGYLLFVTYENVPEAHDIFKRFAKVFEQTYTRFLDLQKAEAQTREAHIEASLERVRSKAMAMHKSEDLTAAVAVVFEELEKLDLGMSRCGIGILNKEKRSADVWTTSKSEGQNTVDVSGDESIDIHPLLQKAFDAWLRQEDLNYVLQGEDLADYYRALQHTNFRLPESEAMAKNAEMLHHHYYMASFQAGGLYAFRESPFTDEAKNVMKRFANVFSLTYKRFQDILKAEAQARESQIEASLERVRSKTMAMHNSQDVGDTVATVFDELLKLNIKTNRCGILIFSNSTDSEVWTAKSTTSGKANLIIGHLDVTRHPMLTNASNSWKNKAASFSYELIGDDLINYYRMISNQPDYPIQINLESLPSKEIHTEFYFPDGAVFAFTPEPIAADDTQIFKRLASVFGQTYRRYLDLQKAEAQAREAQIEAALERVRSRTMAMHRSEEIADIVGKIFKELTSLDVALNRVLIWIFNPDEKYFTWWSANPEAERNAESYKVDYVDHPVFSTYFDAWQKKLPLLLYRLGDDLKVSWEDHLFKNTELSRLPIAVQDGMRSEKKIFTTSAIGEYGLLMAGCFEPFSDEVNDIIQRFGRVFQQSYTRYVDVQKAEGQAREAQIEAALERTRTQSMLMQHSVQLDDTLRVFHEQVLLLGIKSAFSFLWLPDEKNDRHIFWAAWAENSNEQVKKDSTVFKSKAINYPLDRNEPATAQCLIDWKSDQPVHSYHVRAADVENYFAVWKELLDGVEKLRAEYFQGGLYYVEAFMKYGCFGVMIESEMPEEEKKTLGRIAIEFERAYTRFLDLQKAEAQALEATIEASLEKVRGKAMGMHNSNDLTSTASLVFTELRKLGIYSFRSGVGLLSKENRKVKLFSATSSEEGGSLSLVGWAVLDRHPVLTKTYDSWINNEDYFPVLKGESLKTYYEQVVSTFTVPVEHSEGYEQYGYFLPFSEGLFYGWSEKPYTEAEIKILHRFRAIVDLTFRRYMELQKSEENAIEAIRQASLDRVRAEIASMRTTADLDRITPLIWKELNILNIPFVRCGVFIMDKPQHKIHTFLSTPEGKAIAAFNLPYETSGNVGEILTHWLDKQTYISHWDESAFSELGEQLVQQGAIPSKEVYMSTVPPGGIHLHCLPFLQGMLYVGNTTQLQESDIHLIQSVADAFSTAYARYEDFNKLESAKAQIEKTLTDLKQTQNLLVQSEKMASLGELTAGIAHEIQNPLNFVNNFSEVSNELLEEMKEEIEKGNYKEVQAITDSVKQNLEKILHHGKRADGIVKGMLQHSRSSSGVKEPTDINALADEYLRLAYHGFRAKDKSFNASTNTDLDKSIGKINLVPQDIGRVVLNLITNAFYAVTEKQKHTTTEYQPTVFLTTKRRDDCVLISVKDNGNGIPKQIREKIFQPFFTTKPTGQGTGLGLSLSYDIVKAHGGELKVETTEGEGSEFIISIML